MLLIECDGCGSVHESTVPVCPGCGRCPGCGEMRVSEQAIAERVDCPTCGLPYGHACGRCQVCGSSRFTGVGPHGCGFPDDPEKVRSVEKACGLRERRGAGYLVAMVALVAAGFAAVALTMWVRP